MLGFPPISRRGLIAAFVAACVVAVAGSLSRAEPDASAALEESDAETLARVEAYLNGIRSMRADFIQVAPNGAISGGILYLSRPGRLRFEYAPPEQLLVVSSGKWISLIDYEIRQVSRWPISDTPFGVLVSEEITFGDNIAVKSVERTPGLIGVTLYKKKDPGEGSIRLVFTSRPLELRQWEVVDGQGMVTKVGLSGAQTNVALDAKLFSFDDPRPKRPGRRR